MSTPDSHNAPLQFGDWTYDPTRRLLQKAGEEKRVKPLLDRLLQRLTRSPGEVLGRDQLIAEVWTRSHVNDEVLSRAIAELRALLEDDAREPRYIETLSKGGYRWTMAVSFGPSTPVSPATNHGSVTVVTAATPSAPNGATRIATRRIVWIAGGLLVATIALVQWLTASTDKADSPWPDLLHARPLTADAQLEFDPRFDRDGRVAYIRRAVESTASELVLADRRGQRERVLWRTPHALRHPAPAPDGSGIAVLHWPAGRCEVWLVDLLDAPPRRLGQCALSASLEWTPDATALLFTGVAEDPAASAGLVRLSLSTGQVSPLTAPANEEGHHVDPRLSADGHWLIYASLRNEERQLWQTDWPGLRQRKALLGRPEPIDAHAWAANGSDIWVAGDLLRYRALHWLRPDGSIQLMGGRGAQSVDVATDGSLVWTQAEYDGDVWLSETNSPTARRVARSRRHESQPAFSHDGRRLALVSNRGGREGIVVVSLGDSEQADQIAQLALDPAFRWVRPHWTHDDRALILTAYADSRTRLFRYGMDEGRAEPLTEPDENAFHGIELADRRLYRRGVEGHFELVAMRSSAPRAEVIPIGPASAFRANARWLVWRAPGDSGLRVTTLAAPRHVDPIALLDDGDSEAFALSDDWLYFAAQGTLWRQGLPDGAPEPLRSPKSIDIGRPSLAVGPAGQLALAGTSEVSMDLMIVTPGE